jgi:hypothetical protein
VGVENKPTGWWARMAITYNDYSDLDAILGDIYTNNYPPELFIQHLKKRLNERGYDGIVLWMPLGYDSALLRYYAGTVVVAHNKYPISFTLHGLRYPGVYLGQIIDELVGKIMADYNPTQG